LEEPTTRVLVVDDYERWRRFVCSTLEKRPELQVISEVSDGSEAVRKAEELQPDLILLDIGLPTLNGMEAALRIRDLSPKSKILFLSEQRSWDIVEEALRTGGSGYVVKSDAERELLAAVEAVLQGKRFVSASLAGKNTGSTNELTEDPASRKDVAPGSLAKAATPLSHEVGFYFAEGSLLDDLTHFVRAALEAGNAAIVVATAWHRDSLLARLEERGLNVGSAIEQGRYIALDAADTLSMLMVDGMPDPVRFLKMLGSLILTAAEAAKAASGAEQARVAIFGECVHLLWAQGNAEGAIQFEKLGNELLSTYDIEILCGYTFGGVRERMDDDVFQRICAEHTAVHRCEQGY